MVTAAEVVARRRRARARLVDGARALVEQLDPELDVRAVVIFGSVARGDFNDTSDVDLLVIAEQLPDRATERLEVLGTYPSIVEPVAWTPDEWRARRRHGDPSSLRPSTPESGWSVTPPTCEQVARYRSMNPVRPVRWCSARYSSTVSGPCVQIEERAGGSAHNSSGGPRIRVQEDDA